jgi:hypothetical protein
MRAFALLTLALLSAGLGCHRKKSVEQVEQRVVLDSYDATPPVSSDASPTWTPAGALVSPETGLPNRAIALPFRRALLWKKEPELFDTKAGNWRKVAPRPKCADARTNEPVLARIPEEIVFALGATCGYDAEHDTWVPAPVFDVEGTGWVVTQLEKGDLLVTGQRNAFRWSAKARTITSLAVDHARSTHQALRLLDGTVLLSAGVGESMALFVPSTDTFRPLGTQKNDGEATVLDDGRVVFLAPGACGLYDPSAATWKQCAPMKVARKKFSFTATALDGNRLLVAGGYRDAPTAAAKMLDGAEIYDAHRDAWSELPPMPIARAEHVAVRLSDNRVLIAGGRGREPQAPTDVAVAYLLTPP